MALLSENSFGFPVGGRVNGHGGPDRPNGRSAGRPTLAIAPAGRQDPAGDVDPRLFAREIVGHLKGVTALRVEGDAMRDAMVGEGDLILLQRGVVPADGELCAVETGTAGDLQLRRVYREDGRIRLQPEDRQIEATVLDADEVRIRGRVLAIVRQRA
jgi:repressor LexA